MPEKQAAPPELGSAIQWKWINWRRTNGWEGSGVGSGINPDPFLNKAFSIMNSQRIDIDKELIQLCKKLGIKVEVLFQKIQEDILEDDPVQSDDSLLILFYLSRAIASLKNIEPSKVEDLLSGTLKRIKDRKKAALNYSYSLQSKKG